VPLRDFLVGQSARLQLASLLSTIRYCDLIYNGGHADWTIDENEPLVCRLSRHLYSGTNTLAGYEEIKRHSTFDHMSADTSQRQGTSLHTIIASTHVTRILQFVGRRSDSNIKKMTQI
jgi:hypothetical protein